jgi:hypothetical protein
VAVWDELKAVLARLRDQQPGALTQYPVPGAQQLPLVIFRVPPGQTGQVPLLIGTASATPHLGYAIPPGDWGIEALRGSGIEEIGGVRLPVIGSDVSLAVVLGVLATAAMASAVKTGRDRRRAK